MVRLGNAAGMRQGAAQEQQPSALNQDSMFPSHAGPHRSLLARMSRRLSRRVVSGTLVGSTEIRCHNTEFPEGFVERLEGLTGRRLCPCKPESQPAPASYVLWHQISPDHFNGAADQCHPENRIVSPECSRMLQDEFPLLLDFFVIKFNGYEILQYEEFR